MIRQFNSQSYYFLSFIQVAIEKLDEVIHLHFWSKISW